mgnify:CR=1 FL=1
MKLITVDVDQLQDDHMNAEHAQLINYNENTLLLAESKMNYCLIYTMLIDDKKVNRQCRVDFERHFILSGSDK